MQCINVVVLCNVWRYTSSMWYVMCRLLIDVLQHPAVYRNSAVPLAIVCSKSNFLTSISSDQVKSRLENEMYVRSCTELCGTMGFLRASILSNLRRSTGHGMGATMCSRWCCV